MKKIKTLAIAALALGASTLGHCGSWTFTNPSMCLELDSYHSVPIQAGYVIGGTGTTTVYGVADSSYPTCAYSTTTLINGIWTPAAGESFPTGTPSLIMDVYARLDGGSGALGNIKTAGMVIADLTNQQGSWVYLGQTAVGADDWLIPQGNGAYAVNFGSPSYELNSSGTYGVYGTVQLQYRNGQVVFN